MNMQDIISKSFLFEGFEKKNKTYKVYYSFDINIIKQDEKQAQLNQQPNQQPDLSQVPNSLPGEQQPQDLSQQPDLSQVPPVLPGEQQPDLSQPTEPIVPPTDYSKPIENPDYNPSVVTEDDDNVTINDENSIVRKLSGEIEVSKEEVDNIQSIDDVINFLTEQKNSGVPILDEFTSDLLTISIDPVEQNKIKEMISKKSNIFAEIKYGKGLDNSIGIRIIKRKNSDLLTTSMLIDNQILNSKFNKSILDKKIVNFRNSEFD